jgi:hypothetical protein
MKIATAAPALPGGLPRCQRIASLAVFHPGQEICGQLLRLWTTGGASSEMRCYGWENVL